jgi:hypothetical protein
LRRQRTLLGEAFTTQYPEAWLLWHAGPWRPATSAAQSNVATTQLPTTPARPAGEDSLCFLLRAGHPRVSVGRATSNDIVINDLTASRQQFVLLQEPEGWYLDACAANLRLDGVEPTGRAGPLPSGARLDIAEVQLAFFSSPGFFDFLSSLDARAG